MIPVLFQELPAKDDKLIGIATLNAEKSLNSLSAEMVGLLRAVLENWQKNDRVVCVFLQGAGEKAFCAGGDVRKVYDSILACGDATHNEYARAFFESEYRLDYLIHKFPKPIVVWGHGIVMGGGIGLMSGASHRVVTEKSRLAMPEINIGLYPDVGGTWFLNHAPGRTGLFLGLTGASINATDALFVGLADRFIPDAQRQAVVGALQQADFGEASAVHGSVVSGVLREFEARELLPEGAVAKHLELINRVTDADSCAEICARILALETEDAWLQKGISQLAKGCPTTAHLVYEQLRRGKKLSLEQVFQMELIMSLQCSRHGDFAEGVRALLVDKTAAPQWRFASVADVPAAWVDAHFSAPWGESANPLVNLGV
ncbi:Predicted enoyl-CoA hydratase/isomerase family protein [gamma proteobacterium HdN1]|nr:Predicted enoyl-CoA hydratase/isomerase family protein [gamma proteobacterium HdN1]